MMFKSILLILNFFIGYCFILNPLPINQNIIKTNCCSERVIYKNYLLTLRKTKRYIHNTTNINRLVSVINYTNNLIQSPLNSLNSTHINNTEIGLKTITAGNMILDVSNVQYIHISTKKDTIIIELDKNKNNDVINLVDVLNKINNLDALINTLTLLTKMLNIS